MNLAQVAYRLPYASRLEVEPKKKGRKVQYSLPRSKKLLGAPGIATRSKNAKKRKKGLI